MALRRVVQAAFLAFVAAAAWIALRGPRAGAPDAARAVSAEELARHRRPEDCWIAVRGGVYDVTAYLPEHPAPERVLAEWCGKESTVAFDTKGDRGRTHDASAAAMLEAYRVGTLR